MSAAPTTGNLPVRRRNWGRYIQVSFWVAYVVLPWHYGVFFGHRVQCIFFPRDWILHGFAVFGYIALAVCFWLVRRSSEPDRVQVTLFVLCAVAAVIFQLTALEYWQKCL